MAHSQSDSLVKPDRFSFSHDVVDYWANRDATLQALHWVSQDGSEQWHLTYAHFSKQSQQLAVMLRDLGIKKGDRCIVILPRIPEW